MDVAVYMHDSCHLQPCPFSSLRLGGGSQVLLPPSFSACDRSQRPESPGRAWDQLLQGNLILLTPLVERGPLGVPDDQLSGRGMMGRGQVAILLLQLGSEGAGGLLTKWLPLIFSSRNMWRPSSSRAELVVHDVVCLPGSDPPARAAVPASPRSAQKTAGRPILTAGSLGPSSVITAVATARQLQHQDDWAGHYRGGSRRGDSNHADLGGHPERSEPGADPADSSHHLAGDQHGCLWRWPMIPDLAGLVAGPVPDLDQSWS